MTKLTRSLAPLYIILALALSSVALAQDSASDGGASEVATPVTDAPATEAPADAPAADAPATEAPADAEKPSAKEVIDQGKGLYSSAKGGEWFLALGFLGMLIGSIGRWLFSFKWEFWKSKAGGYLTAAVSGVAILGGGLVNSGGQFSIDLLILAAAATTTAMGLHGPAKALLSLTKKKAES